MRQSSRSACILPCHHKWQPPFSVSSGRSSQNMHKKKQTIKNHADTAWFTNIAIIPSGISLLQDSKNKTGCQHCFPYHAFRLLLFCSQLFLVTWAYYIRNVPPVFSCFKSSSTSLLGQSLKIQASSMVYTPLLISINRRRGPSSLP